MEYSSIKAQFFVLMAAILWGTTGSAQALAPSSATPIVIGALRLAIGGIALFILAAMKGAFNRKVKLDKKMLLIAGACMAAYQPFFFSGVAKTGVALGTVLAIGSAPIFSGFIEFFIEKTISKKWLIATIISLIGCILLFSGQGTISLNVFGSILSLGAGLSYALYVKVSQSLFATEKRTTVNGLVFLLSAVILSPILFVSDLSWIVTSHGIITTLYLGIIATALAYTLFTAGLIYISTPKAVTLTLAEPLTASLLGILVLKEKLPMISILGIVLLFCGLVINSYPERKNAKAR